MGIEDMRIRGIGESAQKAQIGAIKDFAEYLGHVTGKKTTGDPED